MKDLHDLEWCSVDTFPKFGLFVLGVWEGDWGDPKGDFRVYLARGTTNGPLWGREYRTTDGEAYLIHGWFPLIIPTSPTKNGI